jgi:lipopolysaccharide/colanic/teichoic acid biosynthesis glycosyltransferase
MSETDFGQTPLNSLAITNDTGSGRMTPLQRRCKRLGDIILASLLLVALSPCLLLIAALIKTASPGPVLFTQLRRGENGSTFRLYKFRSMFLAATDHDCAAQSSRDDPRVTAVGAVLRRHSLDELPQLLNVLFGQMSIVGPRPHALGTNINGRPLQEFSAHYAARYAIKPGITGWAQVNGCRGILDTPDQLRSRISYDLYYIDNWSFMLDLKILLLTVKAVIYDPCAY